MPDTLLIIGDLGGTNARFALVEPGGSAFTDEITLNCEDYETAKAAISDYLQQTGQQVGGRQPGVICLAVAGAVVDGTVRFLNNHWSLDSHKLKQQFPRAQIRLLNDFEAVARSVPLLRTGDTETIGRVKADWDSKVNFTVGVLGPGTGLGVAGLVSRNGHTVPVAGEGGHAGFAAESQIQLDVLHQLRERYERVSNERLLSGPGLVNIYWALTQIHGEQSSQITAPEIFRRALNEEDIFSTDTLQFFYEVLGQVAGDLALKLGAHDGIYIAGGIVRRYPDLLRTSAFRSGFENKGRHRSLVERIPTLLITHEQPGLLGVSHLARELSA